MRLIERHRLNLPCRIADYPIVASAGGRLYFADGKRVRVYAAGEEVVSLTQFPEEIAGIASDGTWLFAQCGAQGFYTNGTSIRPTEIPEPLWGEPVDQYCVVDGVLWFASGGAPPSICALDMRKGAEVARFPLDVGWTGGSFRIWPGPGLVAVEVPMDLKLALAYLGSEPRLVELANGCYVLGFWQTNLVGAVDGVVVREIPSGRVVQEYSGLECPAAMVPLDDSFLLFGPEGVHRARGDRLERVYYPELRGKPAFDAFALDSQIAVMHEGSVLGICEVVR